MMPHSKNYITHHYLQQQGRVKLEIGSQSPPGWTQPVTKEAAGPLTGSINRKKKHRLMLVDRIIVQKMLIFADAGSNRNKTQPMAIIDGHVSNDWLPRRRDAGHIDEA